jgi:hypothetical protein
MPSFIIQRWNAGNDANGNPRRAFVVYDAPSGHKLAAYDEGYAGHHAVPGYVWDAATYLGDVHVRPAEYRHILTAHGGTLVCL